MSSGLRLIPIDAELLRSVRDDPAQFEAQHAVRLDAERDITLAAVSATLELAERAALRAPWIGYLALARGQVVGACSFKHPPDARGAVEIAYFTFPGHERRGHATAMAGGLLAIAARQPDAALVVAHTLPERNVSTRVLERNGFRFVGAVEDPEDGTVWRYERANGA